MDVNKYLIAIVTLLQIMKTHAQSPQACPFTNGTDSGTIDLSYQIGHGVPINSDLFVTVYNCSEYIGHTTHLDLSNNDITQIDEDTFSGFSSLTHLYLSHNQISHIPNGTFKPSHEGVLQYLYFSHNNFTTLPAGTFNLFRLREIHFDHNDISHVEPYVVDDNNEHLELFNMANNSLTNLEPWPYLVKWTARDRFTRTFNLSNNQIANFTNDMNWTYNLVHPYEVEVSLQNNLLESVTIDDLRLFKPDVSESDSYSFLLTLYMNITHNPFFCDCRLFTYADSIRSTFLRWSRVEEFRYRCTTPTQYGGIDWLHDLPLYNLVCNITTDCPNNCTCQERPHNDTMLVDCRGAGLTEFPKVIPDTDMGKIELMLDDNYIPSITNTSYLSKVYNLSMSNNRLTSLDVDILRTMGNNVSFLDFSNNLIRTPPSYIQIHNYDNVVLTGNPIYCDCDSFWLSDWASLSIIGSVTLTCDSKTGVRLVTEITSENLECINEDLIIMGVLIGVSALALLLIGLFVYRCPYETKVLLYKLLRIHPWNKYKVDENESMDIDIYLIFAPDPDVVGWVKKFLVELRKKKPYYRILNPQRFTEPGAEVTNIEKYIAKSKRVLVVLSNFLFNDDNQDSDDYKWRMHEIDVAEDNRISAMTRNNVTNMETDQSIEDEFDSVSNAAEIIYIKYDDLGDMLEDEKWKKRLADKPVFSINERMFMSKIRYELPRKGNGTKYDENIRIVPKRDDIQRLRNARRTYQVRNENERIQSRPGPSHEHDDNLPHGAEHPQKPTALPLSVNPLIHKIYGKVKDKRNGKSKSKLRLGEESPSHLQLHDRRIPESANVNVIQVHARDNADEDEISLDVIESRSSSGSDERHSVDSRSTDENSIYTDTSIKQTLSTWEQIIKPKNLSDTMSASSGYSSEDSRNQRVASASAINIETINMETPASHLPPQPLHGARNNQSYSRHHQHSTVNTRVQTMNARDINASPASWRSNHSRKMKDDR